MYAVPVHCRFDEQSRIAHLVWSGCITLDDVVRVSGLKYEIAGQFDIFIDVSGVTGSELTPDHARAFGRYPGDARRIAIFAPQDGRYAMARIFETTSELNGNPAVARVFRVKEEALAWLAEKHASTQAAGASKG